MNMKNVKIVSSALIISGLFFIASGIFSKDTYPASDYYDFMRGMLTGISSVAAVVWLIFLIKVVNYSRNKIIIIPRTIKAGQILSSIGLFCLFSTAIIASRFLNNYFLTAAGIIAAGASIVLNNALLRKAKVNIC